MRAPSLYFLLLGFAWAGCLDDAPRDNPLDPRAEGFRDEGTISGRITGVYRVNGAFVGRANVAVRFVPVGPAGRPELATRTDDDGFFALDGIPAGPYAVVAEREGFRTASDTVIVEPGRVADTEIPLDELPVVREKSLRTVHIVRWFPPEPVFQLEAEVEAVDPDRPQDVAAAALAIPDPAAPNDFITVPISPAPGEVGLFRQTFDDSELPNGVSGLLGRAIRIEVRDVSDGVALSEPMGLVRIIEQSPQLQTPIPNDVLEPTPTFVWRPMELPFSYTYWVEVYRVTGSGVPVLVDRVVDLPPSQTSYTPDEGLEPGTYSWAVWVVDAFGNRSRSRQNGFAVM